MIILNSIEEMEKYFDKESNTYVFPDSIDIEFDLNIKSNINAEDIEAWNIEARNINAGDIQARNIEAWNIDAWDINAGDIQARNINAGDIQARNIKAWDIKAWNINAWNINAKDISFFAFCISYNDIECKNIKGKRKNSFYKCLDGKVKIIN